MGTELLKEVLAKEYGILDAKIFVSTKNNLKKQPREGYTILVENKPYFFKIYNHSDDKRFNNEQLCLERLQKNKITCPEIIKNKKGDVSTNIRDKKGVLYAYLNFPEQKFNHIDENMIKNNIFFLNRIDQALENLPLLETDAVDFFNKDFMLKRISSSYTERGRKLFLVKMYLKAMEQIDSHKQYFTKRAIHRNFTESNILHKDGRFALVDLYDVRRDYWIIEIMIFVQNIVTYENKQDPKYVQMILDAYQYREKFNEHEIAAIPDLLVVLLVNNYISTLAKFKYPVNAYFAETPYQKKEMPSFYLGD